MKPSTLLRTGCPALVLWFFASTHAAETPPQRPADDPARFHALDIFDLEWADDPQISPDGSLIVYVRRSMDIMKDRVRSNLWTVDFNGAEHRPLLSGPANYRSPRWSPDGSRLAYLSGVEGRTQLFVRWLDTGQTALVTNLAESPGGIAWSPDGRWIAFTMDVKIEPKPLAPPPPKPEGAEWAKPVKVIDRAVYRADGAGFLETAYPHIFVVSADGGAPRQLTTGDFRHNAPLAWTPDSSAIVFSANRNDDWEYDPLESDLWSVDVASGQLTRLTTRKGPDNQPAVSPDGRFIAYTGFDDRLHGYTVTRLYVMKRDGSDIRMLTPNLDRDVELPRWSADGKGVFFQYDDHGVTKLARVALAGGDPAVLADNLGGLDVTRPYTGAAYSVARNGAFAYTEASATRPPDLAAGTGGGPSRQLTHLNENLLGHKKLGALRELRWKSSAADHREIQGWLLTPPDFDPAKKYPLILEIHGGPFAAYGPAFAAELQRYAAEGYLVLYANPRGSTSYGEEFGDLIHHNYPGEDYDDLMAGVEAVIAEGHVDTGNLFVTGGSGGGVLTAWIVGKTDRFKAAVVVKPVINWTSFTLVADFTPFFYKYWFGTLPWEDQQNYWRRSPLSLVGHVKTPTMLITGEADYRTPISETEQFYQALKLRHIDAVMVRVPDSPHDISARPSNLIAKTNHILAWFAKYRTNQEAKK
jgi:dipeptidyl aminopeptidase/acylaminoacyl peptidase